MKVKQSRALRSALFCVGLYPPLVGAYLCVRPFDTLYRGRTHRCAPTPKGRTEEVKKLTRTENNSHYMRYCNSEGNVVS